MSDRSPAAEMSPLPRAVRTPALEAVVIVRLIELSRPPSELGLPPLVRFLLVVLVFPLLDPLLSSRFHPQRPGWFRLVLTHLQQTRL